MSEAEIVDLRRQLHGNLEGWAEPDGIMVPTEPDPAERRKTRLQLKAAIYTLSRVLGDIT
jgi:hypothetical protein